ncbi:MAG: hypothetical protein Q9202_004849 [Teloschistes flavicans]
MRLLHTSTLTFREFFDSQVPDYAILSHRWTDHEVSFEEFPRYREQDWGPEYAKIKDCCKHAQARGWQLVWIDTCCIDKRSSAELNEAINSMYRWYKGAEVCWAYLADVLITSDGYDNDERLALRHAQFLASQWFTRGWTLQELLAPRELIFLDRNWKTIGSKKSLKDDVSQAAHITKRDLTVYDARQLSIAKKLSWLSRRKTTRVEDMAYCMLGLCGVNMPLLYGEGERAFIRLQHEIIKTSDDESIFAWFCRYGSDEQASSILAPSPEAFKRSGHIVAHFPMTGKRPFSITNKGLQYQIPRPLECLNRQPTDGERYSLLLDCGTLSDGGYPPTTSITIDLIYSAIGWVRKRDTFIDVEPIVQNSKSRWEDVIAGDSFFETIFIQAAGTGWLRGIV